MKRFFHSAFVYSSNITFMYIMPCALIVVILLVCLLLLKRRRDSITTRRARYIIDNIDRRLFALFVFIAYMLLPLWSAVILRIPEPRQNPFEDIWGGWGVSNWQYIYDFRLLYNILMFAPMFPVIIILKRNVMQNKVQYKVTAGISILASFLYSVCIELLQIIFKLGTFQISDLVYNTFGAVIGVIITMIIINKIKKGRTQ